MKTTHRNYAEGSGDFGRLCRFMIAHAAHLRSHSTWCLARFVDWPYGPVGGKLPTPGFLSQNARIWFDGFELDFDVGLGWPGLAKLLLAVVVLVPVLLLVLAWLITRWVKRRNASRASG